MSSPEPIRHISAFDLDRTLFFDNSGFIFGVYLYRRKLYSLGHLFIVFLGYLLFFLGLLSTTKVHEIGFRFLFRGQSELLIRQQVEDFLDHNFDSYLYLPAIEKLRKAQANGHLTVLLSNSPAFIVEAIAKRLEVSLWQSTQYALDNERRFCNILHIMQGEDKAHFLNNLCQQYGLSKEDVTAYSDSYLDLPFLLQAGTSIGVNPDRKLRAVCKHNHWPII